MGRHVAVVRGAGIRSAIFLLKSQHRVEAARHQDVLRYLQDHNPAVYAKVRQCRTQARVARDVVQSDRYKVRLYGCHVEPWCFACTNEAKWRRVAAALRTFQACTPAGQQPRFAHIVMTAPIFPDGAGWGRFARREIKAFRDVTWRVTKAAYGAGIGGLLSYQDFGETPFPKGHPHMDYTINGWTLVDGKPERTPTYDLKNGGHARWVKRVQEQVTARWLLPAAEGVTNLNIQGFVTGIPAYVRALAYQLRELVDVRKMTYDRARQLVYWSSYRDNTRAKMTVQDFQQGLADYAGRLGSWGHRQATSLHVTAGHMARRAITKTSDAMGAVEPPHRRGCYCTECSEWEVIFPNEEGEYDFDPWASTANSLATSAGAAIAAQI